MKKRNGILTAILAGLLVLTQVTGSVAELRAVGPVLPDTDPGPGWSAGYIGFPIWYRDTLGQTVELRQNPDPLQLFDPPIADNPFSVHTGFGAEAFWWDAFATFALPDGSADLVLALEAAYAAEDPVDGDQVSFARVRIRIDVPPGTYRVTHPYGVKTFVVPAGTDPTRSINDTSDVGIGRQGDFAGALDGAIGPFLRQVNPAPPAGFLGDPGVSATVTGSPFNTNFFRVERETAPGVFTQIGQSNLFTVSGKLFTGTPFAITRTTLTRSAGGATFVEVFGNTPAPVDTTITLGATLPGQPEAPMTRSGATYFARLPFITPVIPSKVTITGRTGGAKPFSLDSDLVDRLIITKATYAVASRTLTIAALSTDALATLRGLGWSGSGTVGQPLLAAGADTLFLNVPTAPVQITVRSSSGGTVTVRTEILP